MADTQSKPKIVTLEILDYFFTKLKNVFVEKETGKGLSSNDFTDELKNKLNSIISDSGDEYVTTEDIDALFEDEDETSDAGESKTSEDVEDLDGNNPVDDDF